MLLGDLLSLKHSYSSRSKSFVFRNDASPLLSKTGNEKRSASSSLETDLQNPDFAKLAEAAGGSRAEGGKDQKNVRPMAHSNSEA